MATGAQSDGLRGNILSTRGKRHRQGRDSFSEKLRDAGKEGGCSWRAGVLCWPHPAVCARAPYALDRSRHSTVLICEGIWDGTLPADGRQEGYARDPDPRRPRHSPHCPCGPTEDDLFCLMTGSSCAVVEAGFRVLGKLEFLGELKFLSANSKWAHE